RIYSLPPRRERARPAVGRRPWTSTRWGQLADGSPRRGGECVRRRGPAPAGAERARTEQPRGPRPRGETETLLFILLPGARIAGPWSRGVDCHMARAPGVGIVRPLALRSGRRRRPLRLTDSARVPRLPAPALSQP